MVEPFHLLWVNFSKGEGTSFLFITLGSCRAEGPGGDGRSRIPLESLCRMMPLDQPASWRHPQPGTLPYPEVAGWTSSLALLLYLLAPRLCSRAPEWTLLVFSSGRPHWRLPKCPAAHWVSLSGVHGAHAEGVLSPLKAQKVRFRPEQAGLGQAGAQGHLSLPCPGQLQRKAFLPL